jgi:hypothetical protein
MPLETRGSSPRRVAGQLKGGPMQDREAFVAGMAALGVNVRVAVTDAQRDLYWTMLSDLSDADFQRAVVITLNTARFFPTIAELREAVTPYNDHHAAAVMAFERILKAGEYTPTGERWTIRRVLEVAGPLGAEAFGTAGGSRAFEREQGERDLPFLRRRFVESYVLAAEAHDKGRPVALAVSQTALPPPTRPGL